LRIVFGRHPVEALIDCRASEVRRLVVTSEVAGAPSGATARSAGISVEVVHKDRMEALAKSPHHQGMVAEAADFNYASIDDVIPAEGAALVLALDSIQDPQNLGALIRSAEALGGTGIVIPQDRAVPVTGTVGKASAGAIERIAVARVVNLSRALDDLKERGVWITGLAGEADQLLSTIDLTGGTVIAIGAEGTGLRPVVRKACDYLAKIPMSGRTASLNASVAGGIALYEAATQRSRKSAPPRK
jgi:23S rRNA (guanosine2251-2'-O)-methyltransferase